MSKIKRNLGYQTFYQILATCMPLITAPYLARILGAEPLGVFSFTNSVVSYFCLFSMLGVVSYGMRSIATCGEDKEQRSTIFWEIFSFQLFTTALCTLIYALYIVLFCRENQLIAIIQGVNLLAAFTDINWLFFGVEDFKVTVSKNALIKIASVLLILLIVKTPSDLWIYTLIMTASTFLSNVILWYFAKKVIFLSDIKNVKLAGVVKHIKPNLILFVPLMAMQIYHVMDKTMLGALGTYKESGFYYNADKIVSIPVGIITGFGTTMLPRMSALAGRGEDKKSEDYFMISIKAIAMVTIAMAFGIASISKEFVPIFFGQGYDSCVLLIILLSPILIIKGYCYMARMVYLIPNHLEKVYTQSVIVGAIVNLVANIMLIPRYGAIGAVLGTVLAELASCVWQYALMRKYIDYTKALLQSFVYFAFGFLMFWTVRLASSVFTNGVISLLFEIIIGAICFMCICIVYWSITHNQLYLATRNSAVAMIKRRLSNN